MNIWKYDHLTLPNHFGLTFSHCLPSLGKVGAAAAALGEELERGAEMLSRSDIKVTLCLEPSSAFTIMHPSLIQQFVTPKRNLAATKILCLSLIRNSEIV
ncbi:unnamed protein product [Colias eurytheme]|nr:unnamed protein product [Colias eurytheme]